MRAYFASLSDYNAGLLHGIWVEDIELKDETEIQNEINAMLKLSRYPNVYYVCAECDGRASRLVASCVLDEREPCPHCNGKGWYTSAEEWSVHDYDGMPCMGEHPTLESLVEAARLIDEHGDAWLAYVEHVGAHYATEDGFEEARAGEADSEREWVENYLDESGTLESIPENLRNYFNYDAYLRDMKYNGTVSFERIDRTVYAFWC